MSEILFRSLLTLSLGSLLALPFISVREIGRGFFTLWVAIVGTLGVLGLALRAYGPALTAVSGRDWVSILLAASLLVLGAFWIVLRLGFMRIATGGLIGSALLAALTLREIAVARPLPSSVVPHTRTRESAARVQVSGSQDVRPGEGGTLPNGNLGVEGALRTSNGLFSALAVGMVTVAMVLGHWYLVQPKLALAPLRRCCDAFIGILLARLVASGWGFAESMRAGFHLFGGVDPVPWEVLILSQRLLFGFGGALVLAVMIRKTVALRSTMSATGLLYIAILFVWVGEFLSIYLGRLTGGGLVV